MSIKKLFRSLPLMLMTLVCAVLAGRSWAAPAGASDVDLAWKRAMEAGDLDAVVACYGDQAVLWLPGAAEARGRDAIREVYRGLLESNAVSGVTYTRTRYRAAGGLQAGSGEFSLVLTPHAGGAAVHMSGRFSTIVEKENGRWVYTVDHASSNPAQ